MFRDTPPYRDMVRDVSTRLGFSSRIGGSQTRALYRACRYDTAWELDKLAPWCGAFTPAHIQVLNYADDLKHFYKTGPGAEINSHVACPLVSNFIKTLDDLDDTRTTALFTHSSSMGLFFNSLGVGHGDGTLLSSNWNQFIDERRFRTANNSPFATNLAAIRYK